MVQGAMDRQPAASHHDGIVVLFYVDTRFSVSRTEVLVLSLSLDSVAAAQLIEG